MDRSRISGRVGAFAFVLASTVLACGDDDDASPGQDGGAAGSSPAAGELEACELVTQQDASALFGQPATRDDDAQVVNRGLLGQCLWTYEVEDEIGSVSSQLLQFYVWDGPVYHSVPANSDPLDVGEDGYVAASAAAGVDIGWVQDERAILLSYFSIGDDMPANLSKLEPMKALAQEVSDRL
jgi:hypothetical protein